MSTLFRAKTQEGFTFKALSEFLQYNIKTACFKIDNSGISLCMMDTQCKILIDSKLHSNKFSIYKYTSEEPLFVGLTLSHFYKMLKSLKKKDALMLFIKKDNPSVLYIQNIPKDNNRRTVSTIKIQTIQNLDIELPTGYGQPIIVNSSEYPKMCKEINIGTIINVISQRYFIKFKCNADGIFATETSLGDFSNNDDDSDEEYEEEYEEFSEEFNIDQLTRIVKISKLGTVLQIYHKKNLPIKFTTNVGTIGEISVYIKSINQIDSDNRIDTE
jgi:proliferating cell nuclear antigen PCNA